MMLVFFATTRSAFESYMRLAHANVPLWVGAGVLSKHELAALRAMGRDVTDFNHPIDTGEVAAVRDAVLTIQEHHPGRVTWVG